MPRFKDFSAQIKCNNRWLNEFGEGIDTKDSTGNTYQCWVASKQGESFAIHYESELGWVDYKVVLFVDGIRTAGSLVAARDRRGGSSSGVSVSADLLRPYIFSGVQLTDDESLADERIETSKVGEITVKIFRVQLKQRHCPAMRMSDSSTFIPDGMVHEGKKVNGHRTILGDIIQKNRRNRRSSLPASAKYSWLGQNGESEKNPYVTFKIFYRPEATLIAQGLIASPHIEQTQGSEEKVDRSAVERMLFLPSPSRGASRVKATPPQFDHPTLSPEHSAMKRKVREVIDLSTDDAIDAIVKLQRELEETRKKMSEACGAFLKTDPCPVKNEVIDLTLD